MEDAKLIADLMLCILWILTYLSVFLIMFMRKECAINPLTTALCFGLGLGVLISHIWNGDNFNYVTFGYGCWVLVEIGIIILHIKQKDVPKHYLLPFFLIIASCLLFVFSLAAYTSLGVAYCNFIIVSFGMIIWLIYLYMRKQPMHWSYIIPFTTKLIADFFTIYAYFGSINWAIDLICVVLSIIDSLFILLFFVKREPTRTYKNKY